LSIIYHGSGLVGKGGLIDIAKINLIACGKRTWSPARPESDHLPGDKIGSARSWRPWAVVTKDVEPYSIVACVPVKFIKRRFPHGLATMLQELAWVGLGPNYTEPCQISGPWRPPIFIDKYYKEL